MASGTTDEDGVLEQKTITYKQYTGGTLHSAGYAQYLADDITTLTPHTVTVSAVGYEGRTVKHRIDQVTVQVEMLRPPILMTDSIAVSITEDNLTAEITEDNLAVEVDG